MALVGEPSRLQVAVRSYTKRDEAPKPTWERAKRLPRYAVIFDTETTADALQRLNFGCYRYVRIDWSRGLPLLTPLEEGLFYASDLGSRYPDGYDTLQHHIRNNPAADVRRHDDEARWNLRLSPVDDFVDQVLWPGAYTAQGLLVCFNFPFDTSRIALSAGESRHPKTAEGKKPALSPYAGGFSFLLKGLVDDPDSKRDDQFRARILIKSIDSKRALKAFGTVQKVDPRDLVVIGDPEDAEGQLARFHGRFLDLRTLAFALTDRSHSLETACNAFGVPYTKRDVEHGLITPEYIEYCREDAQATERLLGALLAEFFRHPIDLQEHLAFSPATLGKSYLRSMKIRPPLTKQPDFDPSVLGYAMAAYYGGRAETRIRKTAVPVVYCDFLSMYPAVNALMATQSLLTAGGVDVIDATDDFRSMVATVSVEQCFDPSFWPRLVGVAQVVPDGDILPVRAYYRKNGEWQIGINPLTSAEPLWYTFADLVAAALLTRRPPTVLRALRFSPRSRSKTAPTNLLGTVPIDPRRQGIFTEMIKHRKRIEAENPNDWRARSLKVLANATGYGIYAEMRRVDLRSGQKERVTIYGVDEFPAEVEKPEQPGEYCFPPLAASITGAARLMLALLERLVEDAGGSYAFCDTDSMAIVASEQGGLVPCLGGGHIAADGTEALSALTWAQVEEIRGRFDALDPYRIGEPILKLEDENFTLLGENKVDRAQRRQVFCYAISAKRYVLYNLGDDGAPVIRKPSEHGLGHLMNPIDPKNKAQDRRWISQVWEWILNQERGEMDEPEWATRPAVGQQTISQPRLWRLFTPKSERYEDEVKPFNFLNVAFVSGLEIPPDDEPMILVAPYESNPARWLGRDWINRASGKRYRITTKDSGGYVTEGTVKVKTFSDVLAEYVGHEEAKFLAPDGTACEPQTRGLLRRRPVVLDGLAHHIGKETNDLDERMAGLAPDPDESTLDYGSDVEGRFGAALPILAQMGVRAVARSTGFAPSSVSRVLRGKSIPRRNHMIRYIECAEQERRRLDESL